MDAVAVVVMGHLPVLPRPEGWASQGPSDDYIATLRRQCPLLQVTAIAPFAARRTSAEAHRSADSARTGFGLPPKTGWSECR